MKLSVGQQRVLLAAVIVVGVLVLLLLGCTASSNLPASSGASQPQEFSETTKEAEEAESAAPVVHSPAQPSTSPSLAAVKGTVESIVNAAPYKVGVSFIDLYNNGDNFSVNGERPQLSASMIKLGILIYAMNQIDAGKLALTDTYTLSSADIVGGTGVLQGRAEGSTVTVADLLDLMISQSDNTAANVLIDRLGMANINAYMNQLGLDVQLNRKMMDAEAQSQGIDNYMSADAASKILEMLYSGSAGSAALTELANQALLDQFDNVGIIDGLPAGTMIGHKTGSLSEARNDGAIVYGSHPYVLTVMVEGSGSFSESEALAIIAQISEAVYGFWG